MDDADIIRLAREIDELTDSKFRDTNMTELRERIRVRLGELAGKAKTMATTGWTDTEPGVVADLRAYFIGAPGTPAPKKPNASVRARFAVALARVASKIEPKD